jgi:hypothetical protein
MNHTHRENQVLIRITPNDIRIDPQTIAIKEGQAICWTAEGGTVHLQFPDLAENLTVPEGASVELSPERTCHYYAVADSPQLGKVVTVAALILYP